MKDNIILLTNPLRRHSISQGSIRTWPRSPCLISEQVALPRIPTLSSSWWQWKRHSTILSNIYCMNGPTGTTLRTTGTLLACTYITSRRRFIDHSIGRVLVPTNTHTCRHAYPMLSRHNLLLSIYRRVNNTMRITMDQMDQFTLLHLRFRAEMNNVSPRQSRSNGG